MAPIFHPLPRAEVAEASNANDGLTNVVVDDLVKLAKILCKNSNQPYY